MNFGWIREIFKNKKVNVNKNNDLSKIDTSFVKIPKIKDLSMENQDKVNNYFNEIRVGSYETIYSKLLLEKSNKEIDFFLHDLEDSLNDISKILDNVVDKYLNLLIYEEEIKVNVNEIVKIENEVELRLVALDMYIKKEELRKYDFLGIFGKAEKLRYLSDRNTLVNERERLLITIKLINEHLQVIYHTLKDNKTLLLAMDNFIKSNKDIPSSILENHIATIVDDIINKEKIISDTFPIFEKNDELDETFSMEKKIIVVAKEKRKIKIYAYEHRKDYVNLIQEIKNLTNKYENVSSEKWDIYELKGERDKYVKITTNYLFVCHKYITDDILKELRETLFRFNYYYWISSTGDEYSLSRKRIVASSIKRLANQYIYYNNDDYTFEWQNNDEERIYNEITNKKLKELMDKYNISFNSSVPLKKVFSLDKKNDVDNIQDEIIIHYIHDILCGDFSGIEIMIVKLSDMGKHLLEKKCLKKYNGLLSFNDECFDKLTLKDFCYILFFLEMSNHDIEVILKETLLYKYTQYASQSFVNDACKNEKLCLILTFSYLKEIEKHDAKQMKFVLEYFYHSKKLQKEDLLKTDSEKVLKK